MAVHFGEGFIWLQPVTETINKLKDVQLHLSNQREPEAFADLLSIYRNISVSAFCSVRDNICKIQSHLQAQGRAWKIIKSAGLALPLTG